MSRRSAERRCARPQMSEAGVQTCLKYAGPVPRIFGRYERHPAPLWRFSAILAPDINVTTYLLIYLLISRSFTSVSRQ